MKIIIKYDSSWRNSFLDGSNNEPLPKNGRNFIASMTELKKSENYLSRPVSKDTVMGILNRLIGDQRKLYQSRQEPNYYFADLEHLISFEDKSLVISNEISYIRNMKGNTDQNSFTGMIQDSHLTFKSDYSAKFWGILWLEWDELLDFIVNKEFSVRKIEDTFLNPISILDRSVYLSDLKKLKPDNKVTQIIELLKIKFPNEQYIENDDSIKMIRFYAAALYLQLERLESKYDMSSAVNKRGQNIYIYGYSKRGFNGKRDFMKNFVTGGEKLIYGNPYMLVERKKGEGEVISVLHKANGTLEIQLNLAPEQAKDLQQKIEDAGVSAFYLGKKGLAYVDKIVL